MWTDESPNPALFFKMSASLIRALRAARLSPTARDIFDELAFHVRSIPNEATDKGVDTSVRHLAQHLGRSANAVEAGLNQLLDKGILVRRAHERGHGRMRYHLAHPSAWQASEPAAEVPAREDPRWPVAVMAPASLGRGTPGVGARRDGGVPMVRDSAVPCVVDAASPARGTATRARDLKNQIQPKSFVQTGRKEPNVWNLWISIGGKRVPLPRVVADLGMGEDADVKAVQEAIARRWNQTFGAHIIAAAIKAAPRSVVAKVRAPAKAPAAATSMLERLQTSLAMARDCPAGLVGDLVPLQELVSRAEAGGAVSGTEFSAALKAATRPRRGGEKLPPQRVCAGSATGRAA